MHEAPGGKAQKEKSSMCCWKWRNQKIKIMTMIIKLKYEIINQPNAHASVKTLGVRMNPSLNKKYEHEHVKKNDNIN